MLYEAAIANGMGGNKTMHDLRGMISLAELMATSKEITREKVTQKFSQVTMAKNCAIRAIPCGLLTEFEEADEKAVLQAEATLCSDDTLVAARVAASMSWYFHTTIRVKRELGDFIDDLFPGQNFNTPWSGPITSPLHHVHAAITLIVNSSSRMDMIRQCMKFTGEVRKAAIIACAASAPCHEFSYDWPEFYCDQHKIYLLDLDKKLISPDKHNPAMPEPWKLSPIRPEFLKENDYARN